MTEYGRDDSVALRVDGVQQVLLQLIDEEHRIRLDLFAPLGTSLAQAPVEGRYG